MLKNFTLERGSERVGCVNILTYFACFVCSSVLHVLLTHQFRISMSIFSHLAWNGWDSTRASGGTMVHCLAWSWARTLGDISVETMDRRPTISARAIVHASPAACNWAPATITLFSSIFCTDSEYANSPPGRFFSDLKKNRINVR